MHAHGNEYGDDGNFDFDFDRRIQHRHILPNTDWQFSYDEILHHQLFLDCGRRIQHQHILSDNDTAYGNENFKTDGILHLREYTKTYYISSHERIENLLPELDNLK